MSMHLTINKVFKAILIACLAIGLLIGAIGIFRKFVLKEQIPLVLGFGNAVVLTGSMAPVINAGDMVIIQRQPFYRVGDIVAYSASTPVTHRIIETTGAGYITQGDANNTEDSEITREAVIGRVVTTIPMIGHIILFFQQPIGTLVLVTTLFALLEVSRLRKNREDQPDVGMIVGKAQVTS